MTPYRLDVLRLNELKECTVICPDCQTQITLGIIRYGAVPKQCPSCQKNFDEDTNGIIANLREALGHSRRAAFQVEFRIRELDEQTQNLQPK